MKHHNEHTYAVRNEIIVSFQTNIRGMPGLLSVCNGWRDAPET